MNKIIKIDVDNKIHIKTLVIDDITSKYVNWLKDYEVTKYTEQKHYSHTLESVEKFVMEKYNSKNDILFGIFLNNIHIGNIKLGPIVWEEMKADISFFLGEKQLHGKGIASKCVRRLTQYAIQELDLKKIIAGYYIANLPSAKVFEKCGFIIEGTIKQKNNDIVLVGYTAVF